LGFESMDTPRAVIAVESAAVLVSAREILEPHVSIVAAVRSGRAAVEAARQLVPDFMVVDVALPELHGLQVALRLKAAGLAIPIIFLSARFDDSFVVAGRTVGGRAFVPTSSLPIDLLSAVRHLRAGRSFVPSASALPRAHTPRGGLHDLQLYSADDHLVD